MPSSLGTARSWPARALPVVLLALLGCQDGETPAEPAAREPASASAAGSGPQRHRGPVDLSPRQAEMPHFAGTYDDELVELGTRIPGFGGWYFDGEGVATVALRDPAQLPIARTVLTPLLSARHPTIRGRRVDYGRMRAVKARYDFATLQGWRTRLDRSVLGDPAVVFTDVDEVQNRIVVGISDRTATGRVMKGIHAADVPHAAVIVRHTSPIQPSQGGTTLRDYATTLRGGLLIQWEDRQADGSYQYRDCTLGFNVRGSTPRFVTATHCSDRWGGGADGTYFHQPTGPGHEIGYEIVDPPYFTSSQNSLCPPGRRCRWSDALLATYTIDAGFVDIGGIARTRFASRTLGSLEIDPGEPRFHIRGELARPGPGAVMDKVGAVTGWTYGPVANTCLTVDVPNSDVTYYCMVSVQAGGTYGDSGGPVFELSDGNSNVRLAGLFYGSYDAGGLHYFVFSPMENIERELGLLETS